MEDIDIPSKQILVYAARVSPEQTTRGVLFADGHTERWEEEQFRAALPDDVDVDALDGSEARSRDTSRRFARNRMHV